MSAGETQRFMCDDCNAEFEVAFEPKVRPGSKEARSIEPKDVDYCPFCGMKSVEPC